jgi:hypothetical protein
MHNENILRVNDAFLHLYEDTTTTGQQEEIKK